MNKIILVDMDNFFSSIEELDIKDNRLPLIVAGSSVKSVVSSCNAEAKKLGIKSAMPVQTALKIYPNLLIIPVHMEKYIEYSEKIFLILKRFTKNIETSSIDEWYLDFSEKEDFFSRTIQEIAESIKYEIYKTLNLKCSIGISYNKFLAKMACEKAKPFGIFELDKDNFKDHLWDLSINKMHMVGKSTHKLLEKNNIKTIGDLANTSNKKMLKEKIGKTFDFLYNNANGITVDNVDKNYQRRSIGSGFMVYNITLYSDEYIRLFNYHFNKIYNLLINRRFVTDSISAYITINHVKKIKSKKLKLYTNDKEYLYNSLYELMDSFNTKIPFDAFGLSFNNLINEFEIYDNPKLFNNDKSDKIINSINKKLNSNVIDYASTKLKK